MTVIIETFVLSSLVCMMIPIYYMSKRNTEQPPVNITKGPFEKKKHEKKVTFA